MDRTTQKIKLRGEKCPEADGRIKLLLHVDLSEIFHVQSCHKRMRVGQLVDAGRCCCVTWKKKLKFLCVVQSFCSEKDNKILFGPRAILVSIPCHFYTEMSCTLSPTPLLHHFRRNYSCGCCCCCCVWDETLKHCTVG